MFDVLFFLATEDGAEGERLKFARKKAIDILTLFFNSPTNDNLKMPKTQRHQLTSA